MAMPRPITNVQPKSTAVDVPAPRSAPPIASRRRPRMTACFVPTRRITTESIAAPSPKRRTGRVITAPIAV
jgi:hypothetical protein